MLFRKIYDKLLLWAAHPKAVYYLFWISFIESSFFPIAPDVMLAPMVITQPKKGWHYVNVTTVGSVLGGIAGYLLGFYLFSYWGETLLQTYGYESLYAQTLHWFEKYGFWAVVMAGITPIPYKLFTLGAGVMGMNLIVFILASIVGRGVRFYGVGALMKYCSNYLPLMRRYTEIIGWSVLSILGIGLIIYYLK